MQFKPLTLQETAAHGFTHQATVTYADLTQATANTAQTIKLVTLPAGATLKSAAWEMPVARPFKAIADAAFNTTTMSVGDTVGVASHIAATELNDNGTKVYRGRTNAAKVYTAADAINVTFNAMTGKSLVNIDQGEVRIFLELEIPSALANRVP